MAIDKPTPDGAITLFLENGEEHTYRFEDIKTHSMLGRTYVIYFENGRTEFLLRNISRIHIDYNSEYYRAMLKTWSNEAHHQHEEDEVTDLACLLCQPIIALKSALGVEDDQ